MAPSIHKRDSSTGWRTAEGLFVRGEGWLVLDNVHRPHKRRCPALRRGDAACDCGKLVFSHGANIVTNAGHQDIAENYVVGNTGLGSSTLTFDDISVYTAISPAASLTSQFQDLSIPSGGTKDVDTGWPQTSGSDGGDNPGTTGVDVISWRASYPTADGNGTLIGAAIHESGATGTASLFNATAFTGGSQSKTTSQTGKVYLNQEITNP